MTNTETETLKTMKTPAIIISATVPDCRVDSWDSEAGGQSKILGDFVAIVSASDEAGWVSGNIHTRYSSAYEAHAALVAEFGGDAQEVTVFWG